MFGSWPSQTNLGSRAKSIQVDAGCSGFVDALLVAYAMMDAHGYDNALVIGADTASAVTDPQRFIVLVSAMLMSDAK